jgi:very-short-patch-repair endonuclease
MEKVAEGRMSPLDHKRLSRLDCILIKTVSLERPRTLRKDDTEAERSEAIRNRRLGDFKFVRQLSVGPYIADFACRDCKLIVEVDGATHGTDAEVNYDERRSACLREQGYRILRFWNDDVYKGLPDVCDAILLALAERK